jgi:hypothetical protein
MVAAVQHGCGVWKFGAGVFGDGDYRFKMRQRHISRRRLPN